MAARAFPHGWIGRAIYLLDDAAREMAVLDEPGQHSGPEEMAECFWCERRRDYARTAKMAKRQYMALQLASYRNPRSRTRLRTGLTR